MCLPFVHEKPNILAERYLLQHAIMYTQKQRKRKGAIAHEQDDGTHAHWRPVSEHDREYYFKNRKIDRETL